MRTFSGRVFHRFTSRPSSCLILFCLGVVVVWVVLLFASFAGSLVDAFSKKSLQDITATASSSAVLNQKNGLGTKNTVKI